MIEDNSTTISNNGIFICNIRSIPEWLNSDIVYQDINLKTSILSINLSRNQIIHDEKFENFSNILEDSIIGFLTSILNTMELRPREEISEFIANIIDSNFDMYEDGRSERLIKKDINLFNFLLKFYNFKCFSEDGFNLMKYSEISNLGKRIVVLNRSELENNYIQNILFECGRSDHDNLYIMREDHDVIDSMIMHQFGTETIDFHDLFEVELITGLWQIMPDRVNIINIKNLNTNRLITHVIDEGPAEIINVNINNKFVRLIYDYREKIFNENRNLVKELFRYILDESKINMNRLLEEQRMILKWFKEQNLIDETDLDSYLISDEDLEGSTYPFRTEFGL